jgi:hypothetical protein
MAINPSLLVSAAMLQDYLVDNATGLPMTNGTVTLYKDNSRTTFKNWYQLTGSPGSYTFIVLPNPMTLSAVGTIQDDNGNDVIPFYYPYSEDDNATPEFYYIVVTNSNGQQQFTRQDFPFGAFDAVVPVINNGVTLKNYITNNVFWRNTGTLNANTLPTDPISGLLSARLAPSNHDGFNMPDWQFIKNVNDGTDTLTFTKFTAGQFLNTSAVNPQNQDVTPEFFLNYACTGAGSSTSKYVQVPISLHIKTLESTPVVLPFWYRLNSSGGTGGNQLTISILQFAGSGVASPMVVPIQTITMATSTNFTKSIIQFNMPSATGIALGNGGDDALYLQIGYPPGQTFNIDIAKPQLYIGNEIASNDCDTYDQVDAIISSPRTGDLRTSINAFYPFGWVPMNDGTLGSGTSNATARANQDTWPLFNQLWAIFSTYTSGTVNPICQMYNSSGAAVAYGANAIADFSANNQLALTKMMGKVLIGTVPLPALLPATPTLQGHSSGFTATSSGGALLFTTTGANLLALYLGAVVTFAPGTAGTLPTGITANTLYYAVPQSSTTFFVAVSFANAISGNIASYVAFTNAGTPPNNAFAFFNGSFEGEYTHTQLQNEVGIHQHVPAASTGGQFICTGAGGNNYGTGAFTTSSAGTTGNNTNAAGSPLSVSTAFNVVQPSTYMNFYIKL